jgi:superfamily I DNA/RNA helicase
MNLPPETGLSREQKEVVNAPAEGTMLVVGPPGSGKTVVAIMRERSLNNQGDAVQLLVYNNVLKRYTGNDLTFHAWTNKWWRLATGTSFPNRTLEYVAAERQWHPDYEKAAERALRDFKGRIRATGHWRHLILDEAQDFSPKAHAFLFQVQNRVFDDLPEDERPSLCLLADENQRIGESNASLAQIKMAHAFLTPGDEYQLKRNYRNTRQIAAFAAHFYVGLPSGIPELPSTTGDKPKVCAANLDQAVERITRYVRARPNEEVGVLVQYQRTARRLYNKLSARLRNTNLRIQTYLAKSRDHRDASNLVFDTPGVLTVICFASAKGLEFDSVFLPELQTLRLEGVERDQVRMNLYVMCSRARRQLWLMIDDESRAHEIWRLLPASELWEDCSQ